VRAGVSYRILFENSSRALLALDLVREKEEKVKEFIGLDYSWNAIAFRAGYKVGQDLGKYSGGIGFALGRWELHYALTEAGKLGQVHSVSMGYKFGYGDGDVERESEQPIITKTRETSKRYREPKKKTVVAILNLRPQGVSENNANVLSDTLITAFVKKGSGFSIIERGKLEEVMKEKYLHLIKCNDIKCAIEIGNELDAEKVIVGSIGDLGGSGNFTPRRNEFKSA
jgi:hypothetical protein